jgi:CRP/FNR family cyclic AMP-dependent transcriptional regulator
MSLYSNIQDVPEGAGEFLGSISLFDQLSPQQLSAVAERTRRRTFAPGITLFHQDMPGVTLYIVEEGCIRLYSVGRTGQELTLDVLGVGDVLGELSLLDHKPHSVTAITLGHTVVWLLNQKDVEEFIEIYPSLNRSLVHLLVSRVRAITQQIEAMAFQDVQGRLAYEILKLSQRHGKPNGDQIDICIPLTQVDLATMVGATRESVNKALSALRSLDLVQIEENQLAVKSTDGLRKMLQERGR